MSDDDSLADLMGDLLAEDPTPEPTPEPAVKPVKPPTKKQTTSGSRTRKPKKKQTVTIEIDWDVIEQHIVKNHTITNGNLDEARIWNSMLKSTTINGRVYPYGRNHATWESIKKLITKLASKAVIRVTREEV